MWLALHSNDAAKVRKSNSLPAGVRLNGVFSQLQTGASWLCRKVEMWEKEKATTWITLLLGQTYLCNMQTRSHTSVCSWMKWNSNQSSLTCSEDVRFLTSLCMFVLVWTFPEGEVTSHKLPVTSLLFILMGGWMMDRLEQTGSRRLTGPFLLHFLSFENPPIKTEQCLKKGSDGSCVVPSSRLLAQNSVFAITDQFVFALLDNLFFTIHVQIMASHIFCE